MSDERYANLLQWLLLAVITLHSLTPGKREIPSITQSNSGLASSLFVISKWYYNSYGPLCSINRAGVLGERMIYAKLAVREICVCSCSCKFRMWICICEYKGQTKRNLKEQLAAFVTLLPVEQLVLHIQSLNTGLHLKKSKRIDLCSRLQSTGDKCWGEGARNRVETRTKHKAFVLNQNFEYCSGVITKPPRLMGSRSCAAWWWLN